MSTSQETLQQAFEQQRSYFPVPVTAEQESLLIHYLDCVLETNQSLNLTAITEPEEIVRLHVLDSLMVLPGLNQRLQSSQQKPELLDLGTGAGFPGMPLQILRPNWSVTLLDALDKRIQFIRRAGGQVGIPGDWRALHGRGEELGKNLDYRERYSVVLARAVSALPLLSELSLPLVQVGGFFCALKGHGEEELKEARTALRELGGKVEEVETFTLPGTDISRQLIWIKKVKPTPQRYPRPFGKIKKSPLGSRPERK